MVLWIGCFRKLLSTARKRWPDIELSAKDFIAYLAQQLSPERSLLEDLKKIHAADVYLCAACLQEDRAAQQALMDLTLRLVELSLLNFSAAEIPADEVHQQLLERLTKPGLENKPRLALYNGSSRLVSWLRIIVVRTILDLIRSHQRMSQTGRRFVDGPGLG